MCAATCTGGGMAGLSAYSRTSEEGTMEGLDPALLLRHDVARLPEGLVRPRRFIRIHAWGVGVVGGSHLRTEIIVVFNSLRKSVMPSI